MILYKGLTYDDKDQSRLLRLLKTDLEETLSSDDKLKPHHVMDACEQLTKEIEGGQFDSTIKPLLNAYDIPEDHFQQYVSMFKREALEKKVAIELGDDYRESSELSATTKRQIHPLGVLFHIAAGNIDVLPAYSVIEGLLSGNINLLKLPSGDKGVSIDLLSELIRIEPRLKDYIYVFDVPSKEFETLKIFADLADALIVWGGDEAITAARTMASPNTKIIEWGHKLSFAYASTDASEEDMIGLARHIITTNQLMCSSAQGIFVDTEDRETLDNFAERFFNVLVHVQKDYAPVPFTMKSKNAVELYYESMVKKTSGKRIWKQDGISVMTSDDNTLELSLLFRNVWVKMLPSKHIVKTIKPHKNHLQTASIMAPEGQYEHYLERLIQAGVVRIKKPSEMSSVTLGESHDGVYPLRLYTRVVEVYMKP
ncbi:MAG: acyl-CoA reductase [Candidatus Izemoplasmataceae bacterium]